MNENIVYITKNFIEWNELCEVSSVSSEKLENLIQNELIPNASYVITSSNEISSPLGDNIVFKETKKYFPKNIVELVNKNKAFKEKFEMQEKFKEEFKNTLKDNPDKEYAYDNILNGNGIIDEYKFNLIFEQEWNYYCQGIYGICTLSASGSDIAKKEIAVKKLIDFNEKHKNKKLNEKGKLILKKLNKEFNNVSNVFAPYQRKNSSRGKYLDKILKLNSLDELIINYR